MSEEEPHAKSAPTLVPRSAASAVLGASAGSSGGARHHLPFRLLTLLAGVAAGVLSAPAGEKTFNAFPLDPHYPANYASTSGYDRAACAFRRHAKCTAGRRDEESNRGLWVAGCSTECPLGVTGGIALRSIRSGMVGVLVGSLTWGPGRSRPLRGAVPVFFRFLDPAWGSSCCFRLMPPSSLGSGSRAGLALGSGLGGRKLVSRCLLGGLLGALVGTFAFETINSLAFPLMSSFEPVPAERIPRVVVHLCVAIGTAAGAGLAAGRVGNRLASVP